MNTPTHALLNLALLRGRGSASSRWGRAATRPVLIGALLPDLPMFLFWGAQTFALGRTQEEIWSALYFDPAWQHFFDAFNSVPLYAGLALAAWFARQPALGWLALSALLHIAADLPLHREDAHAHFWPLSAWHFVSSVSYWDPAHHGRLASALELALLAVCAAWVGREASAAWIRVGLALGVLACVGGWAFFHL